jgi:alkanesulfonate monooxygenase SsuD/methylene tetrahydromethanopterin reductase-like flavin-dependent oxidoreductase (luciferase family)
MEFGLVLSQFTNRWEHVLADARLAEDVGLDSIWLVDHLLNVRDAAAPAFEAWTGLSVLAGATTRVRLGHLVNCVSFRNPGLLAKMATTLDHASGGRLDLGLGAGWHEPEYRAFGYPFPDAGGRRRYFEAYLEAMVELFAGGAVDFEVEGIRLEGAVVNPPPLQSPHPPIVVGAARQMMLAATGRFADVWNCPAGLLPRLEEKREIIDAAAAGRSVRTTIQVPVAVGRTSDEAESAHQIGTSHLAWMGDLDAVGITGTIDEAVEKVQRYRERGVDGLVGVVPGSRMRPEFIAAYGALARRVNQVS